MSKAVDNKPTCGADEHPQHVHERRSASLLEEASSLFSALGDTARLRLMELLFDGPHCVSELAQETGQSMSLVSQRLKILHQAKLVKKERVGKHIYYRLADEHIVQLLSNAFDHVETPDH